MCQRFSILGPTLARISAFRPRGQIPRDRIEGFAWRLETAMMSPAAGCPILCIPVTLRACEGYSEGPAPSEAKGTPLTLGEILREYAQNDSGW